MKRSDNVLYLTLVDFLLQLIFLGIVLSVLYAESLPDENDAAVNVELIEKIKKKSGISNITELLDILTKMGPLNEASKNLENGKILSEAASKVGGVDKAAEILKLEAGKAPGKPLCNSGEVLATFDAYPDRIELQANLTSEMSSVLKELGLTYSKVSSLNLSSFNENFRSVVRYKPDCLYRVVVWEHSYDTRPRDKFYGIFMPWNKKASDIH